MQAERLVVESGTMKSKRAKSKPPALQGQVQIYTGDGKGKTTAALGLAVRVCGHGGKVAFIQAWTPKCWFQAMPSKKG